MSYCGQRETEYRRCFCGSVFQEQRPEKAYSVISLPKPYDPVDGAEQMIVKKTGRSLSSLKAEEGERFFMHTYEYAPQRKDIEYKVCVIYYFEP